MIILDILAIATRSYVESYGTLTCYLVFLCRFALSENYPHFRVKKSAIEVLTLNC